MTGENIPTADPIRRDIILNERYRLLERLDSGWTGVVWLAEVVKELRLPSVQLQLGERVAAKIYDQKVFGIRGEIDRIMNEFTVTQSIRADNLVRVYDFHLEWNPSLVPPGYAYLIMELADGSLKQRLHEARLTARNSADGLRVLRLFAEIVVGLKALHDRNIIHRDLKSGNILLFRKKQSTVYHAKIADLGVVHQLEGTQHHSAGAFVGALRYQPPEVVTETDRTKPGTYSPRTDLYSLGAILYALLHGREIWEGREWDPNWVVFLQRGDIGFDRDLLGSPYFIISALSRLSKCLLSPTAKHRLGSTDVLLTALACLGDIGQHLTKATVVPDNLVREFESLLFSARAGDGTAPLYVPRKEVFVSKKLPGWSFGSLVLIPRGEDCPGPVIVVYEPHKACPGKARLTLKITLNCDEFAIFKNLGKDFLREPLERGFLLKTSARVDEFLNSSTHSRERFSWFEDACKGHPVPLRWPSGGVLPIAHQDGHDWAVLFFRDFLPGGWNLANGASEEEIELTNIERLVQRESSEEIVLLSGQPAPHQDVMQFAFDFGRSPDLEFRHFFEFAQTHQHLRDLHDRTRIQLRASYRRKLREIETRFAVEVTQGDKVATYDNIIFSINPTELGIELIRLYQFEVANNEWILDGEVVLSRRADTPWLARRPVMLLEIDYLKELFGENGPLCEKSTWDLAPEGRMLPVPPPDKFRLFLNLQSNDDIDFRKRRLQETAQDRKATRDERNYITKWLHDFYSAFLEASKGELKDPRLRTLCPVTWKTLETAFRHGFLPVKPSEKQA